MGLEKFQFEQLGRLFQSGKTISEDIAEISGQDKVTVTLITLGCTMVVAGLLRGLNEM